LFSETHRFERRTQFRAFSETHLNKTDCAAIQRHNIDFSSVSPIVPGNNAQALLLQKLRGLHFSALTVLSCRRHEHSLQNETSDDQDELKFRVFCFTRTKILA